LVDRPDGSKLLAGDEEVLKTINYGGGARWFAKSISPSASDVRLYAINPGVASLAGHSGSPRTTFMVIGAGVSLNRTGIVARAFQAAMARWRP